LALVLTLTAPAAQTVKVRLTAAEGGRVVELPLEEYVPGVLAAESSVFRSNEALKAMAVAARTYAERLRGRHASEGFDFCATTHCQRYAARAIAPRYSKAAGDTAGELLWWEAKPAFTCYTRDCGGHAEAAAAVWPDLAAPYLRAHEDRWHAHGGAPWRWIAEPRATLKALRESQLMAPRALERITILDRTPGGRARTLALAGGGETVRISASSFRFALGRALDWNTIRSDLYEISGLTFSGAGAGHGVGLCQTGADEMGMAGHGYREILSYYYPGASLRVSSSGIAWQRLAGERVALLTTHPETERDILAVAERALAAVVERIRMAAPAGIEIRVYPDLDAYRNVTGEPGWVAAYTRGAVIHLQPAAALRKAGTLETTVRHELFHAALDAHAAPSLPLWFREGLVGYLEHPDPRSAPVPTDAELRNRTDAARARAAAAGATRTVTALVNRYGETTVFSWLKTGLPTEVRNTSNSQAPTKSR
jgi:stage II sporulation protein D